MNEKAVTYEGFYLAIRKEHTYYAFEILDSDFTVIDGGLFLFEGLNIDEVSRLLLNHCLGVELNNSNVIEVTEKKFQIKQTSCNKIRSYTIIEYLNEMQRRDMKER